MCQINYNVPYNKLKITSTKRKVESKCATSPRQCTRAHSHCWQGCCSWVWLRRNQPPSLGSRPDLAPSDLYLFSYLKKDLRGRRFTGDEELKELILEHFETKDSAYFYRGIELLVPRCTKCVEVMGDYIDK